MSRSGFENWQNYLVSGLLLEISNILKEKKLKLAWLIICKEKHLWYVIYKVYRKKAKDFAKEKKSWLKIDFYY